MPKQAPPPETPVTTVLELQPALQPADPADIMQALAFALRYRGRKRVDSAGDVMARITAERLLDHLRASGFVVMKRPDRAQGPDAHYGPGVPMRAKDC